MKNKVWYKNFRERWNSLSGLESQCVSDEFYTILYGMKVYKYTDPCKELKQKCKTFCKNSKILEKHIHSNKKLKDLILYISHPTDVTVKGSQLLPFCSVGYQTDKFEREVLKGSVSLTNISHVYGFCRSSYQRITDIGICTTVSFKKVIFFLSFIRLHYIYSKWVHKLLRTQPYSCRGGVLFDATLVLFLISF